MRVTRLEPEPFEPDKLRSEAGCSNWPLPSREMQPVGLSVEHSYKGLFEASAVTKEDVNRLAAEVAKMQLQFSRALAEIGRKLSQGKAPRSSSRKGRLSRRKPEQSFLPFLPRDLSPISDAIDSSKAIINRQADPGEDSVLTCSQGTWQRATKILVDHALSVWEKIRVTIRPPVISAGPEGSVDLYWAAVPYGLLLNVPADPEQPATYFGDDATNPDSNRTSGKLDPKKPIDVGVLMWLAHTAEQ